MKKPFPCGEDKLLYLKFSNQSFMMPYSMLFILMSFAIKIGLSDGFVTTVSDVSPIDHLIKVPSDKNACENKVIPQIKAGVTRVGDQAFTLVLGDMNANGLYNEIGIDKMALMPFEFRIANMDGEYDYLKLLKPTMYLQGPGTYTRIDSIRGDGSTLIGKEVEGSTPEGACVLLNPDHLDDFSNPNFTKSNKLKYGLFLAPMANEDSLNLKSIDYWLDQISGYENLETKVLYCSFMHTRRTIGQDSILLDNFNKRGLEVIDIDLAQYRDFMQFYRFNSGVLFDEQGNVISLSINPKYVKQYLDTGEYKQPRCYVNGNCKSKKCKVK